MSDYIDNEELENKLSLVIRKPQEGKTTICITSITKDTSKNIHFVLTMNTLTSGIQFLSRMQKDIPAKQIIVFNSDNKTAGECHYADTVAKVMKLISSKTIKVIVCCAHVKKIRESIPEILDFASDSIKIISSNIKFIIHIDEAHKYIPENISYIHCFNSSLIVADIIGYTATPYEIWSSKNTDTLFHKILIRDIETELGIMSSKKYFGVKNCKHHKFEEINRYNIVNCIPNEIPHHILMLAGMKIRDNPSKWYGETWHFDLGNELLMLGFLNFVLPTLQINPNCFSYHFAPSYIRKATHYQNMDIILTHYPTANVIVLNGNGYELFRQIHGKSEKILIGETIKQRVKNLFNENDIKYELDKLNEPSYMIQQLISSTPNYPTFITGFTCVGMSVTFINPEIGNFDSVIMCHDHHSREKLYQLCRFLFNYERWTPESIIKIKRTNFYSLTNSVIQTCLEYESDIERITSEFAGKSCSFREITGLEPEELTDCEIKKELFEKIELKKDNKLWKKFKVYDGNDDDEWEKANKFYEDILGKRICGLSMPKKNDEGFYCCSDSKGLGVQTTNTFNSLEKEKWSNRFQLKKDCLSYAHVFVGYDKLEDPTEYTIFIKSVELVDKPETRDYLSRYYSGKKLNNNSENSINDSKSLIEQTNKDERNNYDIEDDFENKINDVKKSCNNKKIFKNGEHINNYNRNIKTIFTNGQRIRHTIGINTWIGIYDSTNNLIICNGIKYNGRSPLNKFASSHYKIERPDRSSRCNAWLECECEINGEWISTYKL